MKTKWFAPLLMIVLACGSSGLNRAEISKQATVDADGVQRIDVDMHSYYFEPNKIIVKAGTPVEIKLHNCSHVVPHNFTISSGDIVAMCASRPPSRVSITSSARRTVTRKKE
jgi:plastocyanin